MWPAFLTRPPAPLVRPSRTLFFWLIGAFLLTLLPHIVQLPFWLTPLIITALVVRSVMEWNRWKLPSTLFTGLVALCLLAAIYLQFHTVLGREAGVPFMAGLLAIKFFELRGPRDIELIIFSGFFLVMSSLLYSQALELFIYCLIMMWLLTAILLRTQMGDAPEHHLLPMLARAGGIFLQALPLALVLFFFFPRYNGKLEVGMNDASVGLTSHLEPGAIARLSDDDSTAMTVRFLSSNVPNPELMFWRALVLWDYHHGSWDPGVISGQARAHPLPGGEPIEQEITISPNNENWLFALDYPVSKADPVNGVINGGADWSRFFIGDVLALANPHEHVDHLERYRVVSSPILETAPPLVSYEKTAGLRLPLDEISPRVIALARQLRVLNPNDEDYVRAVLHYFHQEGFTYTYAPGVAGKNALEEFLFTTKSGFCEHYASAFAILMRLEGVPARIVVGYHGAQYNPYRNIYVVKQANAHSWDEVWIEAKHRWERVDPTSAVTGGDAVPSLSTGTSGLNTRDEDLSIQISHHRYTLVSASSLPSWMRRSLVEFQLRRQEIEADWDDWIFSYDPQTQSRLARALGFGQRAVFGLWGACLAAAVVCGGIFWLVLNRCKPLPPVESVYAKFCRNMAARGAPRAPWEGPLAYTERLSENFPDQSESIRVLGRIVSQTRYGASASPATPHELDALLRLITASGGASSSRDSQRN